jgi:hypothetical protein
MHKPRDFADAVVFVLNTAAAAEDGPFEVEFTASRVTFANFDQKDRALKVLVMARSDEVPEDTPARDTDAHEVAVDVVITKIVDNSVNTEVDELDDLAVAIRNYLRSDAGTINGIPLGSGRDPITDSSFTQSPLDPLHDHAVLREKSRFMSAQSVTYRYAEARNP